MASARDVKVEGTTSFRRPFMISCRYAIHLKNDKMTIWLENRTSKKQWCKAGMIKADYVTSRNTIADAEAIDYLKCFQDALNADSNNPFTSQQRACILQGEVFELLFTIPIYVLGSTRMAKFSFKLDPVTIKRIDILESKLRDQQDELDALRLHAGGVGVLPFILVHATSKNHLTRLIWNKVDCDDFTVIDGIVKVFRRGVYNVCVSVTGNCGGNTTVQLLKNGSCIQVSYSFPSVGFHCSTSLNSIARMDEGDVLEVMCAFDIWDTSYLRLALLANYC